jgi:hypothetical protein
MTAVDERVGDLLSHIPQASVLTDSDVIESYRPDWALDPQNILNLGAVI